MYYKAIHLVLIHETLHVRFRSCHKIRRHHIKRALWQTLYYDVTVTFGVYPESRIFKTTPSYAVVSTTLYTIENKYFERHFLHYF